MRVTHGLLAADLIGIPAMITLAAPPAPSACSGPEHRQFDFWLGEWDVYSGALSDRLAGRNRIERSVNGCWLIEHWRGAGGHHGTSTNAWDARHRVWRQFWVGGDGLVLRLEGGLQDRAMVMTGELPRPGGSSQRQKISWTPQADGSVVQHWQTSDDDGRSWTTSFRGIYRRRAHKAR